MGEEKGKKGERKEDRKKKKKRKLHLEISNSWVALYQHDHWNKLNIMWQSPADSCVGSSLPSMAFYPASAAVLSWLKPKETQKPFMYRQMKQTVILSGWHAHFVFAAKQKVSVRGHCIMSRSSVVNTFSMFPSQCRTKKIVPIQVNTSQHHHLRRKIIFVISL